MDSLKKHYQELKAAAYNEQRELGDRMKKRFNEEGKSYLTEDEQKQWDRAEKDFQTAEAEIKRFNALEEKGEVHPESGGGGEPAKEDKNKAWLKFIREGKQSLNEEERGMIFSRAQGVSGNAEGGHTVDSALSERIIEAMKKYQGMMNVANILRTSTGGDLIYPDNDDTGNKGGWIAENTQVSETDLTFGSTTLSAYKASSDLIRVATELLEDSEYDMETFIENALSERLGRRAEDAYQVGDGSSKPTGVVNESTEGVVTSSTNSFTQDEIYDLLHSVDPMYRAQPGAAYGFNDTTLKEIKQLSVGSSDARPLWQSGLDSATPDTVAGFPYAILQNMDSTGSGNKPMIFGDMGRYVIRIVRDMQVKSLTERYADFDQVGFIGFMRTDGRLLNAGGGPVKHMRNTTT